jgi:hypothetical protein
MKDAFPVASLVREARKSNRQAMLFFQFGRWGHAESERNRRDSYMAQARTCRAARDRAAAK